MIAIEDQARSIFFAALERPGGQWPAFVDEACADQGQIQLVVGLVGHGEVVPVRRKVALKVLKPGMW